jgi:alpha-galactosidase
LVNIQDKLTGEDLYPALNEAAASAPTTLEPLSLQLFRILGRLPIAGDTHLSEYLPWLHDPVAGPWERYRLPLYDWSGNESVRVVLQEMMRSMASGSLLVDSMREAPSEGATEFITALGGGESYLDETVNVPNQGAIAGLPPDTIVEVPAIVNISGVHPVHVDQMPYPIVELWRREANLVEMVVDAAVTGDRNLALQTLLLDPMINDISRAESILDDYLKTFEKYLPQFN